MDGTLRIFTLVSAFMLLLFSPEVTGSDNKAARGPTATQDRNFYDFKATTIEGREMELDEFRGQVLLVVNVASQCGFTDGHYKALVRLQEILGATGKFSVIGFPCNQFGNQEPEGDGKILEFATTNYGLNFPLFSKVNVLDPHADALWKYLTETTNLAPNWNFWKYLISHNGDVLGAWGPWTDVEEITQQIRTAVNDAVKADPNHTRQASGPPQHKQEDYGDGAGGGQSIWSEGMPGGDRKSGRDRAGGHEPSEGSSEKPAEYILEKPPTKPSTVERTLREDL